MQVRKFVVLALSLCLCASVASAQLSSISPTQVDFGSVEEFVTLRGNNLTGTVSTTVIFDGQFEIEPNIAEPTRVISWIPVDVILVEGTHSVTIRAVDATGTRFLGPVHFVISPPQQEQGNPPILAIPEIVIAEASIRLQGAMVEYDASASDASGPVPITCLPASGATFGLGTTRVTCSASNGFGATTDHFFVRVGDTTPPVLQLPEDFVADTSIVTFEAKATDNYDGNLSVSCSPASGSSFPAGITTVNCIAFDAHLNPGTGSFKVTVTVGPPALSLPADMVEEASSADGAVVTYEATSLDGTPVTCNPASGSTFPLGVTTVNCSATNDDGTSTGSFTVTVQDTSGPVITAPSVVEAEATSPAGAQVTFVATAEDAVDGEVTVDCVPASGTFFAFGTTDVFCSASDSRGNGNVVTFQVIVQDTTGPEIVSATANPGHLWPPNHQMINIAVTIQAVDAVDPSPVSKILSVSSNQPINGTGDGDASPDWVITGPTTLQLRAERSHGVTRIYTITVESTDINGNTSTGKILVMVADPRRRAVR